MSGQPFAANPLNKVWYPPQWLVLLVPPTLHLNLLLGLHLLLAGAGAWTWARATELGPFAAALAGFGYALAPRVIAAAGAGHLDLVYAAAWVPWLLWAIQCAVRPDPARYAAPALALFAALLFLADVRLSAYAYVTGAAYGVWLWGRGAALRTRAGLRRVGRTVIVAGLLTAGLTAIQWVPLLLLTPDLSRRAITPDEAALHSLKWGQWIGLLIGDHGGGWETLVYTGVSALLLAILALVLRPRALAFWGTALIVLALYALGDQFILWPLLTKIFPPLLWWRVPPRAWLIAALIVPYLAAWGAQIVAEHPPDSRRVRLGLVALLGGGLMCAITSGVMLVPPLELSAALGILALPAVVLAVLLAVAGRLRGTALIALLGVIVLADVLWIDRTLIEGRDRAEWLDPYQPLAEYLREQGATRVYSPGYSLPQQAAAYWDVPQFGGVDPFQLDAYQAAAEDATGVRAHGYSVTLPAFEASEDGEDMEIDLATVNRGAPIDARRLGAWLVTHVVAAFPIEAEGLTLERRLDGLYIYRNTFAPDVALAWDGPNRVTIRANTPYCGVLYAVANGRWQDPGDQLPGLPGLVRESDDAWTLTYRRSEVWLGLGLGAGLIALAAALGWVLRHA